MSIAFKRLRQGREEAAGHANGDTTGVTAYRPTPVDVAAVRGLLGLTQEQFAARFGFSVATLRHWERGDRRPRGASLVLLNLIEREPQAVMRALT
jgi:putative transcriptional regulator